MCNFRSYSCGNNGCKPDCKNHIFVTTPTSSSRIVAVIVYGWVKNLVRNALASTDENTESKSNTLSSRKYVDENGKEWITIGYIQNGLGPVPSGSNAPKLSYLKLPPMSDDYVNRS